MAKQYGFNGRISGRLGNTVFINTSDGTVAQQFDPVKPKVDTLAQVRTTTRFRLAHSIEVAIDDNWCRGLSGTRREARARLKRNILNAISVENDGNGIYALLCPQRLVLADGKLATPWEWTKENSISYSTQNGYPEVIANVIVENLLAWSGMDWFVLMVPYNPTYKPVAFWWTYFWKNDQPRIGHGHAWALPFEINPVEWQAVLYVVPWRFRYAGATSRRDFGRSFLVRNGWGWG